MAWIWQQEVSGLGSGYRLNIYLETRHEVPGQDETTHLDGLEDRLLLKGGLGHWNEDRTKQP